MNSVLKKFTKAGLRIKVLNKPIRHVDNSDIFQLSIVNEGKKKRYGEHFVLYRGNINNRVEVVTIDKNRNQLVLFVKEAVRTFNVLERGNGEYKYVQRKTSGTPRKYLVGRDERHLFISALRSQNIPDVNAAHRSLKPPPVLEAEKQGKKVSRQGEWFFVEEPDDVIENLIPIRYNIAKKASLGFGYRTHKKKTHVADELINLGDSRYLVRGRIRHPEHKTHVFNTWVVVYRNTEWPQSRSVTPGWID